MPTFLKMMYTDLIIPIAPLIVMADRSFRVPLYWMQFVNTTQVNGKSLAKKLANLQRLVPMTYDVLVELIFIRRANNMQGNTSAIVLK